MALSTGRANQRDCGTNWALTRTELERYYAVLHLGTPTDQSEYNHSNAVRVETPVEAHRLDERILSIWAGHGRHSVVPAMEDFPF